MAAWTLALLLLSPVDADVRQAVERSRARREILGVAVGRAGEAPFYAINAGTPRPPASNQKVLTAAAALALLGDDFRFETTVARGPRGELIVVGGGDPNFSGRFFDGDPNRILRLLARDVKARGVESVPGGIVLDASRFDDRWVHPDWPQDQLERWYCAPVAALVYNDSCWDVAVYPGPRAGAAARVEIQPALLQPALVNRCVTGGKQLVAIHRADEGLLVRGRILRTSRGIEGHVAVRDPVAFFGEAFRAALAAEGVSVEGGVRRARVENPKPLVVYRTSLARTLPVMLARSQNLYAECIFKRLGGGSFASGGLAVERALRGLGVDTEGLDPRDGSGLARTNRVTPRTLYQTLQAMRDRPLFVESLASGGEGTLRRRFRDLGERVRAKTGTIRGVSTLSGYVTGRDGGRYVFVVMGSGRGVSRARRLQDLVVAALARAP